MFAPAAPRPVAASGPAPASAAGVPAAATVASATPAPAGTAATPTAGAAVPVASEKVTITTDVVKATFDTKGGDLVRLELLKYDDAVDPKQNVVLFDQSAQRVYLAQTGLVTTQPGVSLPNHFTVMRALPGERTLADGQKELSISFESPEIGGVQLVKTYTFKRGEYRWR